MYISNDKEKIREFSDLRRLQLPTRLEISNFRSDVDTSTSTNSISQNSEKCQPLRQETSFFVVCFCSPVANSVHHPLQRIYHLHRVSFGFSRKISSAVDFSRSRRMRRVHKFIDTTKSAAGKIPVRRCVLIDRTMPFKARGCQGFLEHH